jgi:hypothetical protein
MRGLRRCVMALGVLGLLMAGSAWAQTAAGGADKPPYHVHRAAAGQVTLQAFGMDAWKQAQVVEWGPAGLQTSFRALWSDTDLWLRFDIQDPAPWNTMTQRDEHLWEEEVVEIFIDLDGTGKDYAEYQLSPANVICDVRMESGWPNVKSDLTWNHEGIESAVRKRAAAGDDPGGWTGILRLPWRGLHSLPAVQAGRAGAPPKPGETWRFNLYRIERPHGPEDLTKDAVFAAWNPTGKRTFHHPPVFRPMIFAGDR